MREFIPALIILALLTGCAPTNMLAISKLQIPDMTESVISVSQDSVEISYWPDDWKLTIKNKSSESIKLNRGDIKVLFTDTSIKNELTVGDWEQFKSKMISRVAAISNYNNAYGSANNEKVEQSPVIPNELIPFRWGTIESNSELSGYVYVTLKKTEFMEDSPYPLLFINAPIGLQEYKASALMQVSYVTGTQKRTISVPLISIFYPYNYTASSCFRSFLRSGYIRMKIKTDKKYAESMSRYCPNIEQ